MVGQEPRTDFPVELNIDIRLFRKYKKGWLLWRSSGHVNSSGSFVPPVSFMEARAMPKDELDLYFLLDDLLSIKQRQVNK